MYKVESAIIKQVVKCETLDDVQRMFSKLGFIKCYYRGGFNGYKFLVYCTYNNSDVDGIMDMETLYECAGAFYTFSDFKEYIELWES